MDMLIQNVKVQNEFVYYVHLLTPTLWCVTHGLPFGGRKYTAREYLCARIQC